MIVIAKKGNKTEILRRPLVRCLMYIVIRKLQGYEIEFLKEKDI